MYYFTSLFSSFSQVANSIIGGNPNESISGRAFREREDSDVWLMLYRVINTAFFFQGDHCKAAYFVDVLQAEKIVNQHYADLSTIKELLDTMDEEVMKASREDSFDVPEGYGTGNDGSQK